jgi:hypothetical protein
MMNTELAGRASSLSLHHGRQNDERARVDCYPDQDENGQHQSEHDEYPAQRPGVGLSVVDVIARLRVHDRGLPGRGGCHTSLLPSNRSAGG